MSKLVFVAQGVRLEVCPWQFTECKKPTGEQCSVKKQLTKANDMVAWSKAVNRAGSCSHRGDKLTRREYENRHLSHVLK